jgi:hypothetical protein
VPEIYWGVDSAEVVTKDLYNCVLNNFGKPLFWGRYLSTVTGASEGLTQEEIDLLHNSGTKILPIYNNFTSSIGYQTGRITAQNAIFHARRLNVPKGTPLIANVERFFDVNSSWILGWFDRLILSPYLPGYYLDPTEGNFSDAFCSAATENPQLLTHSILWSAEPEPGVTKAREAPTFNPKKPPCNGNVWAWQYGRDAKTCPIDTNLATKELYEKLW